MRIGVVVLQDEIVLSTLVEALLEVVVAVAATTTDAVVPMVDLQAWKIAVIVIIVVVRVHAVEEIPVIRTSGVVQMTRRTITDVQEVVVKEVIVAVFQGAGQEAEIEDRYMMKCM